MNPSEKVKLMILKNFFGDVFDWKSNHSVHLSTKNQSLLQSKFQGKLKTRRILDDMHKDYVYCTKGITK